MNLEQEILEALQLLQQGDQSKFMELAQDPQKAQEIVRMSQQGNELAQQFVSIIQQAQKAQKAAKGTKLDYIRELKGLCPEGYLAVGGRCKRCEAKMKEQNNDPVKSFKAGRKCKK